MKTLAAILLTGAAMVAASPALAGRDETQMMQLWRAIEAKKAENLARAKEAQTGLAGATGAPGKLGPGMQSPKAMRDPSAHP